MQLTSAKNPLIQKVRRAASTGRPMEDGLVVIEGPHLLEEAIESEWRIERIFLSPEARARHSDLVFRASGELVELSSKAFSAAASTETTQEVMALARPKAWRWNDVTGDLPLVLILDGIQDPGNAGTLIRSAEAFGATGAVLMEGSVRVANGKFLRATAGSIFRLPFLEGLTAAELVERAQTSQIPLYALTANGGTNLLDADFRKPTALVVGSEGHGISDKLLPRCTTISIRTDKV